MKKRKLRMIALLLAAALLLSGCGTVDFSGYLQGVRSMMEGSSYVPYESMEYSRPDMDAIRAALDAAICTSETEANGAEAVMDAVYAFYDEYDWFYTCYSLADLNYCHDMTDIYWEKESNYCIENSAAVDAMLEELYYGLAKSPLRKELESTRYFGRGFFDSYEGENKWDAEFTAMMEQENALQARYYELSAQALDYETGSEEYYHAAGEDMAQLLVDMIEVRQQTAAYWGYEDYVQFANEFYYYRDYTPEDMAAYLEAVQEELVDVYCRIGDEDLAAAHEPCTEEQTFQFVRTAAKNMGGTIWEAFALMENAKLYDISYGENKYNASFEVYLTSYWQPFVFMNPGLVGYDRLTLAHEFGHFANDYACYGSYAGVDVTEVYSQGMEYLSLCYGEDTAALARVKLADSLCTYVEQAAFAAFEQQMYALTGEDLSVEGLYKLYDEIARDYGFESVGYDKREFVTITHFFTNPMYIFSYVVSNDAAMQLYQMEQAEAGSGLALMEKHLDAQVYYFLEFLDYVGLESPFAEGRMQEVRKTFEAEFGR